MRCSAKFQRFFAQKREKSIKFTIFCRKSWILNDFCAAAQKSLEILRIMRKISRFFAITREKSKNRDFLIKNRDFNDFSRFAWKIAKILRSTQNFMKNAQNARFSTVFSLQRKNRQKICVLRKFFDHGGKSSIFRRIRPLFVSKSGRICVTLHIFPHFREKTIACAIVLFAKIGRKSPIFGQKMWRVTQKRPKSRNRDFGHLVAELFQLRDRKNLRYTQIFSAKSLRDFGKIALKRAIFVKFCVERKILPIFHAKREKSGKSREIARFSKISPRRRNFHDFSRKTRKIVKFTIFCRKSWILSDFCAAAQKSLEISRITRNFVKNAQNARFSNDFSHACEKSF